MAVKQKAFMLAPPESLTSSSLMFLRHARFRLIEDYFVKIASAIEALNDEQVWRRPNESSNSVGNLLLHLSGNVRQWIVTGVGGAEDTRDRASEFAARDSVSKGELIELVKTTLDQADAILAKIEDECAVAKSDAPLQRVCNPQAYETSVFDAIFHVVEHFSYHTGQIIFAAKWLAEGQVSFYDDRRLNLEK
ncbi:MAG TPA: DinB family protein [Blastocatellia bacterium]|nr:DinB family protein [Blastocatellia bacterium]